MENPRSLLFPRRHTRASLVAVSALLAASGCRGGTDTLPDDDVAEVVLALLQAPADVRCIVVSIATSDVKTRPFEVTPGAATRFELTRLPVGRAVFTVNAFAESCAGLTASSAPTWSGGPLSVVLQAGGNAPIVVEMKRVGQVRVSVDFDPNGAPVCAPINAACLSGGDCCSGTCAIDATPGAVGHCQAPLPTTPSVSVTLTGGKSYLLYSFGEGPGCDPSGGSTYFRRVPSNTEVCISPSVGEVHAVALDRIEVCTAGGGCETCNDPSCLPASCFRQAPLATAGSPCAVPLRKLDTDVYWVLLRHIDVKNPPARPDGLPRFVYTTNTETIRIAPPASEAAFVMAGVANLPNNTSTDGDACGGLGLCGIVPLQAFTPIEGWGFSFTGSFYSSPLF
jgi:hypothetical protein